MGGHGGLNILPQKRWNVYNFDNREKVRRDEEEAAKEEQLKQEQVRKRDAEFRLEQLRTARGLAPLNSSAQESESVEEPESKPVHINLFEGIKIFDPVEKKKKNKKGGDEDMDESKKRKKMKKEEVKVTAEDEKYRLGYGVAGKGVKLPWYLQKPAEDVKPEREEKGGKRREAAKKTVEELREERLRREKREKDRARSLVAERERASGSRSWSRR